MQAELLDVDPEVAAALAAGQPVLALESAMIANGIPASHKRAFVRQLLATVRAADAVPAIIAVCEGRIAIGLREMQLERLVEGSKVPAIARRDLPGALITGGLAATTVSATMACAHMAGIRVFATGGLGGVHRAAATSFDISADLTELGRTPIAVVSSGAKAILDLPKTLEYLETLGVPVIGFGTDTLPAYYSRSSGLRLPLRLDTPDAIADLLVVQDQVMPCQGTVICNPVPASAELAHDEIEAVIEQALADAARDHVQGKSITPYLLGRIASLTGGRSLEATMALANSNALVGAAIAVVYQQLRNRAARNPSLL